jgi:hypothetical protein
VEVAPAPEDVPLAGLLVAVAAPEVVETLVEEEAERIAVVEALAALEEEALLLEEAREEVEEDDTREEEADDDDEALEDEETDATDAEDAPEEEEEEATAVVEAARVDDCIVLAGYEAREMVWEKSKLTVVVCPIAPAATQTTRKDEMRMMNE